MNRVLLGIPLLLSFTLFSCATPQELDRYPKRQIDRPYTLPEGLNTWKTLFTGYWDFTNQQRSLGFGGVFPLNWEQGIADNITLIWSPLPFQIRYQLYRGDSSFWGVYFNFLGPTYARGDDFNWSPTLHSTYRKVLSNLWALEGTLVLEPEINRNAPLSSGTLGVEGRVIYQLSDKWALGLKQGFLYETGDPRSRYFGQLPPGRFGSSRFLFPVYLEAQGMLGDRWQLELEYRFLSIPSADAFTSHQMLYAISYFW